MIRRLLRLQWVRFVVVGALNTLFSYAVYALFLKLGLPYAAASLIALLIGMVVSFRTQGTMVFGNRDPRRIVRFVVCWGLIYLCNIAIIGALTRLGFDGYAAGALALVPVTALSFVVQKFFVFADLKSPKFVQSVR